MDSREMVSFAADAFGFGDCMTGKINDSAGNKASYRYLTWTTELENKAKAAASSAK